MSKRRPAFDPAQMGFTFETPAAPRHVGALAGLSRVVSSAVARILHEDGRSRRELAYKLSEILDEDIGPMTLDGWASEARDAFNVPLHRALALIAVTERVDVLDALARQIGAAVLFGPELQTARLGHIDRKIAMLRNERKIIEQTAVPIGRAEGQNR